MFLVHLNPSLNLNLDFQLLFSSNSLRHLKSLSLTKFYISFVYIVNAYIIQAFCVLNLKLIYLLKIVKYSKNPLLYKCWETLKMSITSNLWYFRKFSRNHSFILKVFAYEKVNCMKEAWERVAVTSPQMPLEIFNFFSLACISYIVHWFQHSRSCREAIICP
jgi:hypothetical protein